MSPEPTFWSPSLRPGRFRPTHTTCALSPNQETQPWTRQDRSTSRHQAAALTGVKVAPPTPRSTSTPEPTLPPLTAAPTNTTLDERSPLQVRVVRVAQASACSPKYDQRRSIQHGHGRRFARDALSFPDRLKGKTAVQCPRCKHENQEGASFCSNCGNQLELICQVCSERSPLDARFCWNCGNALTVEDGGSKDLSRYIPPEMLAKIRTASSDETMRGERRTVTMLFADVRGYSYSREDVSARMLANAYASYLDTGFTEGAKPFEVELLVAELMDDVVELYRVRYDGFITDEDGYVAIGGSAETITGALANNFDASASLDEAVRGAKTALDAANGNAEDSTKLEVAGLDRTRGRRKFFRLPSDQVQDILS
jgi:proteasome alpha subunit